MLRKFATAAAPGGDAERQRLDAVLGEEAREPVAEARQEPLALADRALDPGRRRPAHAGRAWRGAGPGSRRMR